MQNKKGKSLDGADADPSRNEIRIAQLPPCPVSMTPDGQRKLLSPPFIECISKKRPEK
jgi:hypothetical protein